MLTLYFLAFCLPQSVSRAHPGPCPYPAVCNKYIVLLLVPVEGRCFLFSHVHTCPIGPLDCSVGNTGMTKRAVKGRSSL